jgi:hypothetical protein
MKKLQLVLMSLLAVFAFGVLSAEVASAATFLLALWLVKGAEVTAALSVQSEGELLLEDTKGGLFLEAAAVLCSGILDGTVNPASLDVISELLTLSGTAVSTTPLSGGGLTCTNEANCPEPDKVWAVNLPWNTEVELVEDTGGPFFADLILPHSGGGNPGWEVECFGISDECLAAEGAAQLTLSGSTLLGSFTEAFRELVGAPRATCTRGGASSGIVISDEPFGAIKLVGSTEELSASSETSEA